MGKRSKKGAKQTVIAHKETFQRMNYLYQAAMMVLGTTPSQPQLSRFYIRTLRTIGTRMVLRMDPSIKRTLCKSCDSLLVPGVTCTQRLRAKRERHVVFQCLTCGSTRRFLARSDYQLWTTNPENIQLLTHPEKMADITPGTSVSKKLDTSTEGPSRSENVAGVPEPGKMATATVECLTEKATAGTGVPDSHDSIAPDHHPA